MADFATADGLRAMRDALAAGLAAQNVTRVDELDLEQLAAVLATGLAQTPNPLDPEGDGLKPSEINSSNDI
jgi:hypothetical protein